MLNNNELVIMQESADGRIALSDKKRAASGTPKYH